MMINQAVLYTHLLDEMKDFYVNSLDFPLTAVSADSFSIKVGESELTFKETSLHTKPFYHFAFNVPANRFMEAKKWATQRVFLNTEEKKDEIYFEAFDAHSFYFEDPAHNIVEYISRYSDCPPSNDPFSSKSLLSIGEINLTTPHVRSVGTQLINSGITVRNNRPLNENFNFLGSDSAFFLVGAPKRRWFFSDRDSEVHPLTVKVNHSLTVALDEKGMLKITQ
ncbi:glyoxalase [Priestia aryabhattai]|uniref:glyoxalase n=1 Tax=Priestia TaxID=2800373 RepID=UPI0006495B61|nr:MULTISPECIES: glyoxalase [Priestia]MCM2975931.1 glyoxalase [Priestia aryabhattai]MED3921465.1 glyoxalase [Priestia aryabhattai]MED3958564.1 glyoxalase [Priestia aryabhattai]MED3988710.1 glyoxalase [Priestia aryabhattai]MED4004954.1 glyoxalase [Priestia aryabhattai]